MAAIRRIAPAVVTVLLADAKTGVVETLNAVESRLLPPEGVAAGKSAFTQTFRNGKQVWVHVRNGLVVDAGVNGLGGIR